MKGLIEIEMVEILPENKHEFKKNILDILPENLKTLEDVEDLSGEEAESLFKFMFNKRDLEVCALIFEIHQESIELTYSYGIYINYIIDGIKKEYKSTQSKTVIDQLLKISNPTILNSIDEDGNTLLHLAISYGKLRLVNFFIKKFFIHNVANHKGETPASLLYNNILIRHVSNDFLADYLSVVRKNMREDEKIKLNKKLTDLIFNSKYQCKDIVDPTINLFLQGAGDDGILNRIVKWLSISGGTKEINQDILEFIISYVPDSISAVDKHGNTAFHNAAIGQKNILFEAAKNISKRKELLKNAIFYLKNNEVYTAFECVLGTNKQFVELFFNLMNFVKINQEMLSDKIFENISIEVMPVLIKYSDEILAKKLICLYFSLKNNITLSFSGLVLHLAILNGNDVLERIILDKFEGFENYKDSYGKTAADLREYIKARDSEAEEDQGFISQDSMENENDSQNREGSDLLESSQVVDSKYFHDNHLILHEDDECENLLGNASYKNASRSIIIEENEEKLEKPEELFDIIDIVTAQIEKVYDTQKEEQEVPEVELVEEVRNYPLWVAILAVLGCMIFLGVITFFLMGIVLAIVYLLAEMLAESFSPSDVPLPPSSPNSPIDSNLIVNSTLISPENNSAYTFYDVNSSMVGFEGDEVDDLENEEIEFFDVDEGDHFFAERNNKNVPPQRFIIDYVQQSLLGAATILAAPLGLLSAGPAGSIPAISDGSAENLGSIGASVSPAAFEVSTMAAGIGAMAALTVAGVLIAGVIYLADPNSVPLLNTMRNFIFGSRQIAGAEEAQVHINQNGLG